MEEEDESNQQALNEMVADLWSALFWTSKGKHSHAISCVKRAHLAQARLTPEARHELSIFFHREFDYAEEESSAPPEEDGFD